MSGPNWPSPAAADLGDVVARDGTIVAIATAQGRGALATIRLSGPEAFAVAAKCIDPWPLADRSAVLVQVRDPRSGDEVDRGIAVSYRGPRSFTGEDVVEVSAHGGAVAPAAVLAAFVHGGARPAARGEFTRRAVLNGKLDLLQAEAIGDLIDAPTGLLHRAALAQLSGALTTRISQLRESLVELEALLVYDIDFPEEDDGPIARSRVRDAATVVKAELASLLSTLPAAHVGRHGAVVTLAGVPNAGKSSLFNALLGEARAIVTDIPGTTRDAIEALIEAEPYPWRLVDTAGLRAANDLVERLGVEISARWLARADIVLLCGPTAADRAAAARAVEGRTEGKLITVRTMSDRSLADGPADRAVSAVTGAGLDQLRELVNTALADRFPRPAGDVPLILRARHEVAIAAAHRAIDQFLASWQTQSLPAPVAATHVHHAIHSLDSLIGVVDTEDVLTRVFSRFCVGK
jgi:tRNA modification GTPase